MAKVFPDGYDSLFAYGYGIGLYLALGALGQIVKFIQS